MDGELVDREYQKRSFNDLNADKQNLSEKSFYNCTFKNCSFQFADLNSSSFEKCIFQDSNLSLAKTRGTRFLDAVFINSKLLGINWGECNKIFKASFENCPIKESSFVGMNLQRFTFQDSYFKDSLFSNSNLSHAKFQNCDLEGCVFHGTKLFKTDFSTSYNYFIKAEANQISKAIFSLPEATSLLQNFDIRLV